MIPTAVDAMGGDHAPRPEVEGSVLAAREFGVQILLVGQPNVVRGELAKHAGANLPIEVVPAGEVVPMQGYPAEGVPRKKDTPGHLAAPPGGGTKGEGLRGGGDTRAGTHRAGFLFGRMD